MKPIVLLPLLLAACHPATFEPECVESGRTHTCNDAMPRSCFSMLAHTGLDVTFETPVDVAYEVALSWDGESDSFACAPESVDGETFWRIAGEGTVRECGAEGFAGGPAADEIEVTVTVDGQAPITTTVAPCWDITEPNGRCCGFAYRANETVPAF